MTCLKLESPAKACKSSTFQPFLFHLPVGLGPTPPPKSFIMTSAHPVTERPQLFRDPSRGRDACVTASPGGACPASSRPSSQSWEKSWEKASH